MTEPETPTRGTYTFLFTDIEGSTSLEDRIGRDRYGELRERHRALLREVWTSHGGTEQGTEGDSFFVVFTEAPPAVEAAVAAQRALIAEPWPDDAPIRVRMGLNSGGAGANRRQPRRAERQPRGTDRRRSHMAARSWRLGSDERPAARTTRSTGPRRATSASTGSRTSARPCGSSRSRPTGSRPISRRSARSTPARTTCRPS